MSSSFPAGPSILSHPSAARPSGGSWEALLPDDLPAVRELASCMHPTLPERLEVLQEKLRLFPLGCRKRVANGSLMGYAFSHPGCLGAIPPLDSFLEALPARPDCLYLHDIVIAPRARGANAAGQFIDYARTLATGMSLPALALVSVYGTFTLWRRYGFETADEPALRAKLASYGPSACYMVCRIR